MIIRSFLTVAAVSMAAACGGSDGDEQNRITRIDGPATVTDDGGAELDGAPTAPPEAITAGS